MRRAFIVCALVVGSLAVVMPAVSASTTEFSTTGFDESSTSVDDTTTTTVGATTSTIEPTTTTIIDPTTTTAQETTTTTESTTTTTTTPAPTTVPLSVPSAPVSLIATPGNGTVALQWLAPSTGGSPITDYVIQRSSNGTTGWINVNDGVATATSYTASGLTNGTRYYFRVYARNVIGDSLPSIVTNTIPRTVPTAPRTLAAVPGLAGQVRLTWLAPASTGGSALSDYVIQRSPNGTSGWATINDGVRNTTGYTVTGLANGTRYYFRVYARNLAGQSPASNLANAIPRTVPTAPRTLAAVPGLAGQVRLTWLAPASTGGSALSDYVIQRSPNGTTGWINVSDGVRNTTGYTVTGLTNGARYYFRVYARNLAGQSPASNLTNTIPRTVPTAPRTLAATAAASGQIRLTWLAPASTGGSALTDYVIQRSPNGTSGWATINDGVRNTTGYTVTGIANGTRYYFRVYARNAAGLSPASNLANAVPRAPTPPPRCDPSYPTVCIRPGPPDLDCGEISFRRFKVLQPDPHGFDGDKDGIGCES